MANSITGINDLIIANSALEAFTAEVLPVANVFASDFSDAAAKRGDIIHVPRTIAADAATTKVTHTAYTIQDADSDYVSMTLDEPVYVSWGLDDVELSKSSVLSLELFGRQKGFQLAKKILQDILGEVTNANFSTAAFVGAASTFDSDDVADIKNTCDLANMPATMRSLVLAPAYYNSLLKDGAIKASDAFGGSEAIRGGTVPMLDGFRLYMSNLIPANGENLVGFACHPSAMTVAARYLQPQDGNTYSRIERLTDPGTGITIGLRQWYSNESGVNNRVLECIYAWETGIAAGLKRITSA